MAKYNLLLPRMGESVSEATIVKWSKQPGDSIAVDETVLEIATDKVDSDVPSPIEGKLLEQRFKEGEVVQVGDCIAIIEIEGEQSEPEAEETSGGEKTEEPSADNPLAVPEGTRPQTSGQDIPGLEQLSPQAAPAEQEDTHRFYSPLVKSIAKQEGISLKELEHLKGSGLEGRLTKRDMLEYLEQRKSSVSSGNGEQTAPKPAVLPSASASFSPGGDEIIEMDRMRKLIASHMSESVRTAPHVTSFLEVDVSNIVRWREEHKQGFQEREGTKITYTPIFIEAITKAIRDFPMINVSVDGSNIIKKGNINIGMATALPSGNLIVPVIHNADRLNLVGLSRAVNDLAARARENRLKPDEVQGGTFTVTNIGSFGNLMGTPIINQPQVAILAIGAIVKKPAVMETEYGDVIAIRHKMYLSLSYDHRVVDGALGGMFIRRIADYLEAWDLSRLV